MAPTFFGLVSSLLLLSTSCDARSLPKSLREPIAAPPVKRADIPTTLPGNWSSYGCLSDSVASRSLNEKTYLDTTGLTVETCIGFCSDADYIYAGMEYSQECCTFHFIFAFPILLLKYFSRLLKFHRKHGHEQFLLGLQHGMLRKFFRDLRRS